MQCRDKPPTTDVLWADGRGRAWFCDPCLPKWIKENGGRKELEIVGEKKRDGEVPEKWSDAEFLKTADQLTSHIGVFVPLPADLAKQYPKKVDDPSPAHVTFLYVGDVPPARRSEFTDLVKKRLTT